MMRSLTCKCRSRCVLLGTLFLFLFQGGYASEPQWHYPDFQEPLLHWLKGITEAELEVEVTPIELPTLTEAQARRYYPAADGHYALFRLVATQLSYPASAYLWEGGIWRADEPLIQGPLKDGSHGLETGQIWIPGHPNMANILAWVYNLDEPWNPYYHNEAVAKRAAIISIVDLLMQAEFHYFTGDARSTRTRKYNLGRDGAFRVHPGITGFTLTFQAFNMLHLRKAIDPSAFDAWEAGFRLFADRFELSPNTGPGNMLLSPAIAFYYAYLATNEAHYLDVYQYWEDRIVTGELLSPAGIYYDGFGRAPDASYDGISLHRIAELYAINPSERIKQILDDGYKLKSYFTLVEPDGMRTSPSHFNDRSPSAFAHDQYQGREVMIAGDIPWVAPFLRAVWRDDVNPVKIAKKLVTVSQETDGATTGPYPWGSGEGAHARMHDWEAVLSLPYVIYRQNHEVLEDVLANGPGYPIVESDYYTENFANEFYAIRRPAYSALFYTGAANQSDTGRTNYRGQVDDDGGYFNGFAGGGMSAFWVPEVGTTLIGRMNSTEGYGRVTKHKRFVPGWQDWANNHVIGETESGKILTSARTSHPYNQLSEGSNGVTRLDITGDFVTELKQQGEILPYPARYRRRYVFQDSHIEVDVGVKVLGGPTVFKSLYETLPLYLAKDTVVQYLDVENQPVEPVDARLSEVKYVILQRAKGGTCIAFQNPVVAEVSQAFESRQQGPAIWVKALQIAFPEQRFTVRDTTGISYRLIPFRGDWSLSQLPTYDDRVIEALFPVESVRDNLLQASSDFSDPVWKKSQQGQGELPIVEGNVVLFDAARGEHYSTRSKIDQLLTLEVGQRYLLWLRARSDVSAELSLILTGGEAKDVKFVSVEPGQTTESWVVIEAEDTRGSARIWMAWKENLENKARVTIEQLRLEAIDEDTLLPIPGGI